MPAQSLGSELRRLRTSAAKSLRSFAGELEISAAHLSDIEHDRRRPSEELLLRLTASLKHVGAVFEQLRAMNTAIDSATREWASKTPYVGEMLRQVRESQVTPEQVIEFIERQRKKREVRDE